MPPKDVKNLLFAAATEPRVWSSILNNDFDEAQRLANENYFHSRDKVNLNNDDISKMKSLDKSSLHIFTAEARKKGVSE